MTALWNGFKIAFSMYSKIPMPQSDWSKKNMRYALGFFPLVGGVIGLIVWATAGVFEWLSVESGQLFRVCVLTCLPILISGGIHLDGFLDVSDALSSWQEKERRLEILKDSHAGAFAIICCAVYFALYTGAVSVVEAKTFQVLALGYVAIRAGSGLSLVTLKMAKNTGLAATFSDGASKRAIRVWMAVYLAVCVWGMCWMNLGLGLVCTAVLALVFFYYRRMSYRNFGGINGDLAGWFLQVCELGMMLAAAVLTLVCGGTLWNG